MNRIRSLFRSLFLETPVEDTFSIRFSDRTLWLLILPLIAEQFLGQFMGIMDTVMVSSLGDASVSGVSLIDQIFNLFFNIFSALATGGAVVASRNIGAGKPEWARRSAVWLLWISLLSSVTLMAAVYLFDEALLRLLFGSIADDVMAAAILYIRVTLVSFPAVALSNAAAALFRSDGNSKISMMTSAAANVLNIVGNALFLYVFRLGVFGAALATVIGRVLSAVFLLWKLGEDKWNIRVDYREMFRMLRLRKDSSLSAVRHGGDGALIRGILSVGLPGSLESGTFQLGRILVVSIISTFGTAQITANAVANNLDSFGVMPGFAFNLAIVTVVGQCVGAGDWRAVRYYTAKMIRLSYAVSFCFNLLLFAALPLILNVYSISAEARAIAVTLILIHNGIGVLIWTPSFVLPNAMKAVGDAKFVMVTAMLSMFIFRVGFSSLLGSRLAMGAVGVWWAMILDWIVRVTVFALRWRKISRSHPASPSV